MARSGKAAVCRELNKPVVVETISVDSPKRGEVMVKGVHFPIELYEPAP